MIERTAREIAESALPAGVTLFGPRKLSRITGVDEAALKRWRHRKSGGPAFTRIGRLIRYPRLAVVDWLEVNTTLIEPKPITTEVGRPARKEKSDGEIIPPQSEIQPGRSVDDPGALQGASPGL